MENRGIRGLLGAFLAASLALSPFIAKILAQTTAQVTIESKIVAPGVTTIVHLSIEGVPEPGLLELKVGPKGEFAYDPQVVRVIDVAGIGPYTVTSKTIDNQLGKVEFAASAPEKEVITDGAVVGLEVEAIGNSGESTTLRITRIDAFHDPEGNDIPYMVNNGVLSIEGGPNQPPQADFILSPERPSTYELIRFTDRSTDPDGEVVSWEWDFGDGTTSTKQNPTHRYTKVGAFTVRLTVTDDRGAIDRTFRQVIISEAPPNQPPIAYFTFSPERPTTADAVQFTDGSSDPDGEITFRFWDFGDGSSSVEENPTHRYASSGRYVVVLTVADNRGATDSFAREVTVSKLAVNQPPQAAFTFSPSSPTTQDTVSFFDQSSDPDGEVVLWWWDFGDGATSTLEDPTHGYTRPGTYTVTLKVADDDGATDSVSHQITVAPAGEAPQAGFTISPENPKRGEEVRFTDRSSDPDGVIVRWSWDFGDGTTSTAQNPSHRYAAEGTYTVKLTVTDDDGLSDTAVGEITVGRPKPKVLVHCFPNPASAETTFTYTLPDGAAEATLYIFDITGSLAFQRELSAAVGEYPWDLKTDAGEDLPNGPYFYRVVALGEDGRPIARSTVEGLLIQRGAR